MTLLGGEKLPCRMAAAHLVFAIMGTFAFSMADTFDFSEFEENQTVSGGFLTSIEHPVDWLIEVTTKIGISDRYSSSPLRNGTARASTPPGIQNAGVFSLQSSLKAIKKVQYPNIRDAILLKLRI